MRTCAFLVFAALLCVVSAFSQSNTGSIVGTMTDATGAVVPGVKVTVSNNSTGVQITAVTDNVGNYRVDFLPPGTYQITVENPGFKKFVRDNIVLDAARQLRIDLVLET